jgi:methionyl aminopeptidase
MNSIHLKTPAELEIQHKAGQLLAQVFLMLDELVKPGISTMQINDAVEDFIRGPLASRPASKGQYDYQYVLNSSINEVVCHGMPKQTDILKEGDIVNLDITLEKEGFIADSSKMYCLGKVSPLAQRLVDVTYQALWQGIYQVKPGARLGDIAQAVQQYAERHGYSVVREYCGHGIGREMHEEPQILHYGKAGTGLTLKPGMVFTGV